MSLNLGVEELSTASDSGIMKQQLRISFLSIILMASLSITNSAAQFENTSLIPIHFVAILYCKRLSQAPAFLITTDEIQLVLMLMWLPWQRELPEFPVQFPHVSQREQFFINQTHCTSHLCPAITVIYQNMYLEHLDEPLKPFCISFSFANWYRFPISIRPKYKENRSSYIVSYGLPSPLSSAISFCSVKDSCKSPSITVIKFCFSFISGASRS